MSIAKVPDNNREISKEKVEELFREHYRFVYRTAYGITGRRHDAEDVLQTLFMRLIRNGFSPELRRNPKAYLYRAAVNQSLNVVRSRQREVGTEDLEYLEFSSKAGESSLDDAMRRKLLDSITTLKLDTVGILILHYEHGYTDAEIAPLISRTREAVAKTLCRARKLLREVMLEPSGEHIQKESDEHPREEAREED